MAQHGVGAHHALVRLDLHAVGCPDGRRVVVGGDLWQPRDLGACECHLVALLLVSGFLLLVSGFLERTSRARCGIGRRTCGRNRADLHVRNG
ncbi:hypothetical protein ABTY00_38020, partial [Streptomyces microflavus]|uniref:hypothetical protein n=1 Tax=Streptomyces microflavus TaxID=1919 RepID=UPI00332FF9E3